MVGTDYIYCKFTYYRISEGERRYSSKSSLREGKKVIFFMGIRYDSNLTN